MTSLKPEAFTAALGLIAANLRGLAAVAGGELQDGLAAIAESAVTRLVERTPRSDLDHSHIADGWTARNLNVPGVFSIEVYNKDPRASTPLRLADGTETPYTLLDILEYGSRPHIIRPVNAKALHFMGSGGDEVFAQEVEHPGTRPYAMVAITEAEVAVDVKKLIDRTRRTLALSLTRTGTAQKYKGGKRAAVQANS